MRAPLIGWAAAPRDDRSGARDGARCVSALFCSSPAGRARAVASGASAGEGGFFFSLYSFDNEQRAIAVSPRFVLVHLVKRRARAMRRVAAGSVLAVETRRTATGDH